MNKLEWRTVSTLELTDKLIPNPNAQHQLLDRLHNVRVAIEGSFLHIDPRQPQDIEAGAAVIEFEVHIVPASSVQTVVYRDSRRRGSLTAFP